MIVSVTVERPIKAGEELFVDYGYIKGSFPWDHLWYHKAKEEFEKEQKEKKEAEEREKQNQLEEEEEEAKRKKKTKRSKGKKKIKKAGS